MHVSASGPSPQNGLVNIVRAQAGIIINLRSSWPRRTSKTPPHMLPVVGSCCRNGSLGHYYVAYLISGGYCSLSNEAGFDVESRVLKRAKRVTKLPKPDDPHGFYSTCLFRGRAVQTRRNKITQIVFLILQARETASVAPAARAVPPGMHGSASPSLTYPYGSYR